eukprot:s268_g30.t1
MGIRQNHKGLESNLVTVKSPPAPAAVQECMRPRMDSAQKESIRRGTLVQTYDEMDWEQAYVPPKPSNSDPPAPAVATVAAAPVGTAKALATETKKEQVTAALPPVLPAEPVAPSVPRVPCAPVPLRVWAAPGGVLRGAPLVLQAPAFGAYEVPSAFPAMAPSRAHGMPAPTMQVPTWARPTAAPSAPSSNRSSSVPHVRVEKRLVAAPISFIPATAKAQGPGSFRPVQEWQEAEVCQWLSEVFMAPKELVQMVEQQAITGKVLLSLNESDLAELSVPKFGHRRLLMLAAHELRRLSTGAVSAVNAAPLSYAFQASASSPSSSVNGSGPQLCVGGPGVTNGISINGQAPPSVRSTLPGALNRGNQVLQYPCPQSIYWRTV